MDKTEFLASCCGTNLPPPNIFITPVFPTATDDILITQLLPSIIPQMFAGPCRDCGTERNCFVCVRFLKSGNILIKKNGYIVDLQYYMFHSIMIHDLKSLYSIYSYYKILAIFPMLYNI